MDDKEEIIHNFPIRCAGTATWLAQHISVGGRYLYSWQQADSPACRLGLALPQLPLVELHRILQAQIQRIGYQRVADAHFLQAG
jgi:hypothetical protein